MPKQNTPQQPVQAAPAPETPAWTPPAEIHEAAKDDTAPADVLHNLATQHIQNMDENTDDVISDLADNKATPAHTIHALMAHVSKDNEESDHDLLSKLALHPNAPAAVTEEHIRNTTKKARENPDWSSRSHANEAIEAASKKSGVNEDVIKEALNDYVEHGGDNSAPTADINPRHFLQMLAERPEMYPEADHLTDEQRKHNERAKRIDKVAIESLRSSSKHDPETLEAATQLLSSEPRYGQDFEGHKEAFVQAQKGLNHQQLDRLWNQDAADWQDRNANEEILRHHNASPTLLASVANNPGSSHSERQAAFSNPSLPREVVDRIINSPDNENGEIGDLLHNKNLSPQDLEKLYANPGADERTKNRIVQHEGVSPELQVRHWAGSDKSTATAREMLQAKQLPPEVLKQLVNHKNQDLAVEALKHPSINEDVLEAAVKRKAATVSDAAARHPLLAGKYFDQRVSEGKLKGSELFFNKANMNAIPEGKLPEYTQIMNERYKGASDESIAKTKETPEDYFKVKVALSNSPDLSPAERDAHKSDIAKEFKKHAADNQNFYSHRDDHFSTLGRTVIANAKAGHEDSENALLSSKKLMGATDFTEGHRPEFLAQAYNEVKSDPESDRGTMRELASNPKLPQHVFDEMTADPEFYKDDRSYLIDRGNDENVKTVFDSRWKEDPQKDEKFAALASNPEAAPAVVRSAQVPSDSWNKAFNSLDDESRDEFMSNNAAHAATMADDTVYNNMLNGAYNGDFNGDHRYGRKHNDAQLEALKAASVQELPAISNMLTNTSGPDTPDKIKIRPVDFANAIGDDIYSHPQIDNLINTAMKTHPGIGTELQAKKILEDHGVGTYSDEAPAQLTGTLIDKLKTVGMEGVPPEEQRKMLGDRIGSLLEDYRASYAFGDRHAEKSNTVQLLKKANPAKTGALDFIADGVTGDPDFDDHLRQLALGSSLISDAKVQQIMDSSPEAFAESMASLKPVQKGKKIREILSSSQMQNPDTLRAIVNNMSNATLNPAYDSYHRRGATHEEHITAAGQHAQMLGQQLAHHGMVSEIGLAATKILKPEVEASDGGFSKAVRQEIFSKFVDGATNITADPLQKNRIISQVYATASKNGQEDLLPSSMITNVVKTAIKQNDVQALIDLSTTKNPPKSIGSALAKFASNPEILKDEHLAQMPVLMENVALDGSSIRKISNAYTQRFGTDPEKMNQLYSGMYNNMSHGKIKDAVDPDGAEAEVVRSAAMNPHMPASQACLTHIARNSTDKDNAKAAYLTLPDQVEEHMAAASGIELPQDIANDPQIMQRSTAGWRLSSLVRSVDSLNEDNRSILSDRLANYPGDDIEKADASSKVALSKGTKPEDAMNLYRSLDSSGKAIFMKNISAGMITGWGGDYNKPAVSALLPHVSADLSEDIKGANTSGDSYDLYAVGARTESLSKMAQKFANDCKEDKSPDVRDRAQQFASDAMDRSAELLDKVEAAQAADPEFYAQAGAKIGSNVMNAITTLANIDGQKGLDSQKIFDQFHRARGMYEASGHSDDEDLAGHISRFSSNWMSNANPKPEDWGENFKKLPEMQFYVSNRESIPAELYQGMNVKQMMTEQPTESMAAMSHVIQAIKPEDANGVIPTLLDQVHANAGVNENAQKAYSGNARKLVLESVDRHPTAFSAQYLKNVMSRKAMDGGGIAGADHVLQMAYDRGAGGREFFQDGLHQMKKFLKDKEPAAVSTATALAGSPHLKEEDAQSFYDIVESKSMPQSGKSELMTKLLDNQQVPEAIVNGVYSSANKAWKEGSITDHARKNLVNKTIKHKNLPRSTFFQLYEDTKDLFPQKIETNKPFNPALVNPRFGGELFRSMPLSVPKSVPNVDSNQLVSKATHGGKQEKIKQALAFIPPEGIAWGQFKKVAPKLENVPEIKQMFMSKNNKPIRPEDVAEEMRKHAPDEFHVTYSSWNGMQRHMGDRAAPNLVVQLNTGADMESKLNQDPKLWNFFQFVQKSANHTQGDAIGGHPVTPHIASWVRVDTTGGKDGWAIEEFQSDFSAKLRKQLKHAFEGRSTIDIDGQKYTKEETDGMVKHIEKTFQSWVDASYQAVEELARKHGVKDLFVHGQGLRRKLSGISEDKHVEVFDEAYERQPAKRGFSPCDYTDYPVHSKAMAKDLTEKGSPEEKAQATKCWRKRLA